MMEEQTKDKSKTQNDRLLNTQANIIGAGITIVVSASASCDDSSVTLLLLFFVILKTLSSCVLQIYSNSIRTSGAFMLKYFVYKLVLFHCNAETFSNLEI